MDEYGDDWLSALSDMTYAEQGGDFSYPDAGYTPTTGDNTDYGYTTTTYDDGSTLTFDVLGNIIGATPSTDTGYSTGLGFSIAQAASKLGDVAFNKLKSAFTKSDGSVDWRSVAGAAGGLYGLYQANQGSDQQPKGYQGGIPQYVVNRTRLELPDGAERRPGAYGRRYFSDVSYSAPTPPAAQTPETAPEVTPETPPATIAQDPGEQGPQGYAAGGIAAVAKGRYLRGHTDGMADKIPARIGGTQEAALSHGEFVVPADVVSHLGNGNSDAGAKRLYDMMDRIRKARTGTTRQGKQVDPNKFLPS